MADMEIGPCFMTNFSTLYIGKFVFIPVPSDRRNHLYSAGTVRIMSSAIVETRSS